MKDNNASLQSLKEIRTMMERSSRFISLSGLSGVSAGVCALVGAWLAYPYYMGTKEQFIDVSVGIAQLLAHDNVTIWFNTWLFWIATGTLSAALVSAFLFTYIKSKKQNIPLWGYAAKRLIINVFIPLIVGGIFLLHLANYGTFGLIAPGCLIFYGLALLNAGKYTLPEIRYLGLCEILLGVINLWFTGYGLYFWAVGFGVLHIAYGIYMWMKYERKGNEE